MRGLGILLAVVAALFVQTGCSRPSGAGPETAPSASAVSAIPRASASSPPPEPTAVVWTGTYTSAPGSLYVRDGGEWKGVRFRGDDAAVALGEGSISLTVDAKTGQVRGNASGALGDVVLAGAVTGDVLAFSVLRKDATDRGLTGTGAGAMKDGAVAGTMRLSADDAHVIREAKFSMTKGSP